ncbi:hypothetical protein THIOM_005683 [Candidatus Thiomargarita nelsonii]|uniref:Uncharacterized protein n=1 Tax=Candidatus Thiomargarita nelsonii TaxID=1003181 RepID=A0A176RSJ3_9GAMM|nr:hypothetical protein THIOM_005683 [Candidatus Thiomargarita nelsonii]
MIVIRKAYMLHINNHPIFLVFGIKIKFSSNTAYRWIISFIFFHHINFKFNAQQIMDKSGENLFITKSLLENHIIT